MTCPVCDTCSRSRGGGWAQTSALALYHHPLLRILRYRIILFLGKMDASERATLERRPRLLFYFSSSSSSTTTLQLRARDSQNQQRRGAEGVVEGEIQDFISIEYRNARSTFFSSLRWLRTSMTDQLLQYRIGFDLLGVPHLRRAHLRMDVRP